MAAVRQEAGEGVKPSWFDLSKPVTGRIGPPAAGTVSIGVTEDPKAITPFELHEPAYTLG